MKKQRKTAPAETVTHGERKITQAAETDKRGEHKITQAAETDKRGERKITQVAETDTHGEQKITQAAETDKRGEQKITQAAETDTHGEQKITQAAEADKRGERGKAHDGTQDGSRRVKALAEEKGSNRRARPFISKDNFYFLKWLFFIAAYLILGGVLAFALILLCTSLMSGEPSLRPIWIVGMIPLMTLIAVPLTVIIYRQIAKNLIPLVAGMARVAGGDLDTYIPTANAKDFAKVYENFNKMVSEIQSIETLRSTMFDNLSHEIKTPVASISGFSRILAEKELAEEKKQKYLQIIIDESLRLDNLVKNVLLLSKLDSTEIISHKEEYSLSGQLQDCVISLENEWTAKEINISADLEPCIYSGEPQLMKSLWLNLISNAVKFTPPRGDINVTLKSDASFITVSVSDTGAGIGESDLKHIFERHYQSDKRIAGGGQGLGLPIVKRIVKLCGGTITVESRLAQGSTFTVVLPK